ncbi:MAG: molybdopterin converting factor subunit 1 [Gemmataceae bacterium]
MQVRVLFFARARELAETDCLVLELPAGASLSSVRESLASRCPRLASFLGQCLFAVNKDFASDCKPLQPGDEIAVLPPVSGG